MKLKFKSIKLYNFKYYNISFLIFKLFTKAFKKFLCKKHANSNVDLTTTASCKYKITLL